MTHAATPPLPYGKRSTDWCFRRLLNLFGAGIVNDIWFTQDSSLDPAGVSQGITGRIGIPLAVVNLAEKFGTVVTNGRLALKDSIVPSVARGVTNAGLPQFSRCQFALANFPATPFANYYSILETRNLYGAMMVTQGAGTMYMGQGTSHVVDGVATQTITQGIHVVFGTQTDVNCSTIFTIGTIGGAPNPWAFLQERWVFGSLNVNPSLALKQAATSILFEYIGVR